jgi:GTP-binding protein HflX
VTLPSRRQVLLSDTVGFIRNLPHTLITSFRATLEEVQKAALILHVSDASSPLEAEQNAQVERVLQELDVAAKPRLRVMNKIDLLPAAERDALRDAPGLVHISAAKSIGLTTLLERIDQLLLEDPLRRVRLRVPQAEGKMLALLEARARIYSRQYLDGAVELEAELPESVARKVSRWITP